MYRPSRREHTTATSRSTLQLIHRGCLKLALIRWAYESSSHSRWRLLSVYILRGKDISITLPIAFGKSATIIVAFLPSVLACESSQVKPNVLVSTLIVLIRDQVAPLTSWGVKAACLCSSCPDNYDVIVNNKYSHLFTSSESILQDSKWRKIACDIMSLFAPIMLNHILGVLVMYSHTRNVARVARRLSSHIQSLA